MNEDIGTNLPASAGAEGVQGTTPPGYEAGAAGVPDADQGQPGQSDGDLPEGGEGESGEPATAEVEFEGQKYTVPKALEAAILKNADYTQKTQELADTTRQREQEFSQREQDFSLRQQAAQVLGQGHAQLAALDIQLQQYQGIDWSGASARDPASAQQAWMQFQQLRDQRAGVAQQLQAAEQQFLAKSQQDAIERVRNKVAKWTPDEQQAVNELGAKVYGITQRDLALFGSHPALLDILRDAVMHQKATQTAAAATKAATPKAPPVKPAPQLPQGGKTAVSKSMGDPTMGVDEWMRRRNEQVRKRK